MSLANKYDAMLQCNSGAILRRIQTWVTVALVFNV